MSTNPKDLLKMNNPWHLLATGFGSGLAKYIPGTMGTLAAIPLYLILTSITFWLVFSRSISRGYYRDPYLPYYFE